MVAKLGVRIPRLLIVLLTSASLLTAPAAFSASRMTKGAMVGAAVGLISGHGIDGIFKGAALGAGAGALTDKGRRGHDSRKGAEIGAVVGVAAGLLSGNGINGALKGAVVGGAGGAILGRIR
ncbi:MAG: glycine zipper family protein [Plesiomonas sp.]|uniref:glycine zipper family protein n=1 Tax=Plesiomonas sp. TaxID=2486279 RepID=UPI003F3DB100